MTDQKHLLPPAVLPLPVVLIVEDEPALRLLAADVAEAAGLAYIEANDAEEAISYLENRSDIQVVFTDIHLRGSKSGLDLAAIVHDRWPSIGLVITSGWVIPHRQDLPARSFYFPKPYDIDKVVAALQSCVTVPHMQTGRSS
jgi:CheY-like chemotaxis protein